MKLIPSCRTLSLVALTALGACSDRGSGPSGPAVTIEVAPLDLPDVGNACYTVTVRNSPVTDAGDVVWSEQLCTAQYGTGSADISYVGACDADVASGQNSVELVLDALYDQDGNVLQSGSDYQNPCDGGASRCIQVADCKQDKDTRVVFNLTILRDASQGFFDVAVRFKDLFCSAKVDCSYDDNTTIALLSDGTDYAPTAVLAFACTSGRNKLETNLYMDDVDVTCTGGVNGTETWHLDAAPASGLGNQAAPTPLGPIFGWAVYAGEEQLPGYTKGYWNVAVGLEDIAVGQHCTLHTRATASEQALSPDGVSPVHTSYPVIDFDVVLNQNGTALSCGENPVNGAGSGVRTTYTTLSGGGECFDHQGEVLSDNVTLSDTGCVDNTTDDNTTDDNATDDNSTDDNATPFAAFGDLFPGEGNDFGENWISSALPVREDGRVCLPAGTTGEAWWNTPYASWTRAVVTIDFDEEDSVSLIEATVGRNPFGSFPAMLGRGGIIPSGGGTHVVRSDDPTRGGENTSVAMFVPHGRHTIRVTFNHTTHSMLASLDGGTAFGIDLVDFHPGDERLGLTWGTDASIPLCLYGFEVELF